jgi:hypothetical protein
MSIMLTEEERRFLSNEFLSLMQNANLRDLFGTMLIQSILGKLSSTTVTFSPQENGLLQSYLVCRKERLAGLTDKRLQFILQSQNSQGFGAPGSGDYNKVGGPGGGGSGDKNHFFDSHKQYDYCTAIIEKLKHV